MRTNGNWTLAVVQHQFWMDLAQHFDSSLFLLWWNIMIDFSAKSQRLNYAEFDAILTAIETTATQDETHAAVSFILLFGFGNWHLASLRLRNRRTMRSLSKISVHWCHQTVNWSESSFHQILMTWCLMWLPLETTDPLDSLVFFLCFPSSCCWKLTDGFCSVST